MKSTVLTVLDLKSIQSKTLFRDEDGTLNKDGKGYAVTMRDYVEHSRTIQPCHDKMTGYIRGFYLTSERGAVIDCAMISPRWLKVFATGSVERYDCDDFKSVIAAINRECLAALRRN